MKRLSGSAILRTGLARGAFRCAACAASRGAIARLVLVLAVCLVPLASARAEIGAYLLFDMANGKVLAKHRASTPWYPASLTKLMTAYVTFKAIEAETLAMTSPVRISPQASQQPPSRMGFKVGTVITVETALRIILTKSANDVSVALAEAVSGTSGRFIDAMNKTAADLGMSSSSFDNPHGLPNSRQIITARDMALLMMAIQNDFPQFADYFDMGGVRLGKQVMRNHNNLMRKFRGTDGMKTGFICASGFNLAATVTRDGVRLGAVVLGGTTSRERDERTAELLAKGFEALESGGAIALDGFDEPDALFAYAPVTGERPEMGTVAELPAADEPVADIRSTVCGARRPVTRYDNGVNTGLAAFEAQREALLAWQKARNARDDAVRAALATPRDAPTEPAAAEAASPTEEAQPAAETTEVASADAPVADAAQTPGTSESNYVAAQEDPIVAPNPDASDPPEGETVSAEGPASADEAAPDAGDAAPAERDDARDEETAAEEAPERPAPPKDAAPREFAGAELVPASWTSTSPVTFPLARPGQPPSQPAQPAPLMARAEFAPDDWLPSRASPKSNPLPEDLRLPLRPQPEALPLTYLEPVRNLEMVDIAIGGADETRPDPLSGTIIGGGRAPLPPPRPQVPVDVGAVSFTPIEPSITETAIEVREAATEAR